MELFGFATKRRSLTGCNEGNTRSAIVANAFLHTDPNCHNLPSVFLDLTRKCQSERNADGRRLWFKVAWPRSTRSRTPSALAADAGATNVSRFRIIEWTGRNARGTGNPSAR